MILYFLADIFRNPNLQKEYEEDPDRLMKREGLTGLEIELLKSRDVHRIAACVATEVKDLFQPTELWGGPILSLTSIKPGQAQLGKILTASVVGTYFEKTISCRLEQDRTRIRGEVHNVQTGAQSSLSAIFAIPPDAPVGSYSLVVEQPGSGSPESATLTNAVTISG